MSDINKTGPGQNVRLQTWSDPAVRQAVALTAAQAQADKAQRTARVLDEVYDEREAQDEKWGEQNHPILSPECDLGATIQEYATTADSWKEINQCRVNDGTLAWDGIALEELYEAFAEGNPARVRAEAVQAAAVLVAMIECIDRAAGS